jgi:hypothetical protein
MDVHVPLKNNLVFLIDFLFLCEKCFSDFEVVYIDVMPIGGLNVMWCSFMFHCGDL